jgi:hypothetical protein
MKVAIQISGHPRFNSEWFIKNCSILKNYDQIDWFFLLWNTTHADEFRIASDWPTDIDQIRNRLSAMLPPNSNIAHLSVVTPPVSTSAYTTSTYVIVGSSPLSLWTMFSGIKQVNDIRQQYESTNGAYDVVVQTRGDISLIGTIDFAIISQQLTSSNIMVPMTTRYGPITDVVAVNPKTIIGLSSVMNTYSVLVNDWDSYYELVPMPHENVFIGHHLTTNGIDISDSTFSENTAELDGILPEVRIVR